MTKPKRSMRRDRDRILDLWACGSSQGEIADLVGDAGITIGRIVAHARNAGDPRAVRRQGFGTTVNQSHSRSLIRAAAVGAHHVRVRQRNGERFPVSIDELIKIARATSVPVQQCPPAWHAGWKPKWA